MVENSDGDKKIENSKIQFKTALHPKIANKLMFVLEEEYFLSKKKQYPGLNIQPIQNNEEEIIGIDFGTAISEKELKKIHRALPQYLDAIIDQIYGTNSNREPTSFTEILGTYRIQLSKLFIPILICICSAMFLGYMAYVKAGIQYEYDFITLPDEVTIGDWGKILVNGIIPVVGSAIFVTILWFLIKKFGLIVLKITMGILVLFYTWYGFIYFISIPFLIYGKQIETLPVLYQNIIVLLDWTIVIGSFLLFIYLGIQFFKNKLSRSIRNYLVLGYGIFMGAILGISFSKWTIISFGIFLSIWDIITVFYGPLGKIANKLKENQMNAHNQIQESITRGDISKDQGQQLSQFVELQEFDLKKNGFFKIAQQIEIELGSGDLILYSALVANVFILTASWLTTLLVIGGIMTGVFITVYLLVSKRKMLPALPISMFIGVTIYLIHILL